MILTIAMELRDARLALKKLQDSSTTRRAHRVPPPRIAWAPLPASAPGLGAPFCHICTGTELAPTRSALGLGSPLPHLHRNRARSCPVPDASCHAHRRAAPHACRTGAARMRAGTLCAAAGRHRHRCAGTRATRSCCARRSACRWRCNTQQTTRLQHATRTRQRGCNTQQTQRAADDWQRAARKLPPTRWYRRQ